MHVAVDVAYGADGSATAAGIAFADPSSGTAAGTIVRRLARVRPYRPGHFYERELPCVLAVLEAYSGRPETILPETILIDGYVTLDAERRDGLGMHLFRALGETVPVIGVAKSRFRGTPAEAEVLRGGSVRPLYVTSAGMDEAAARGFVLSMHGAHRVPTLLAAADRACRMAGRPRAPADGGP